jgi:hypothetical protein
MTEELNLDFELPWPDGDDPYKLTPGALHLIACLNFTHDEPWYGIAEGFKRIADLAVAHIAETGHDQDFLVYPVLFCYRHYLELMLKQLLRDARRLYDVEDDSIPGAHSLIALWDKLEPLMLKHTPDPTTYANVRASLARFDHLDPRSDSYRYPVDKQGDPHLKGLHNVDLGQVSAVIERLAGFLDGASTAVQVDLDAKHEMAEWYGP